MWSTGVPGVCTSTSVVSFALSVPIPGLRRAVGPFKASRIEGNPLQIIPVPGNLESSAIDQLAREMAKGGEEKVLFDARHLRWVDPGGIVGLLAAGAVIRERQGTPPRLQLADAGEVPTYLARMNFFEAAEPVFELDIRPPRRSWNSSDVLLEVTPRSLRIRKKMLNHETRQKVARRAR